MNRIYQFNHLLCSVCSKCIVHFIQSWFWHIIELWRLSYTPLWS